MKLLQRSSRGQSLYGLQLTNQQRIIIFGGGLPVIFNEQVIGAVGVSGGTVEQDQLLAQCALGLFFRIIT